MQMGGSIASAYARIFRIGPENLRVLLMAGVAAGFGSVFGTPLTGAIFAMEVLTIGQIQYEALIPALIASIVGDLACAAWGRQTRRLPHCIRGTGRLGFALVPPRSIVAGQGGPRRRGVRSGGFPVLGTGAWIAARLQEAPSPSRHAGPIVGGVLVIALTYLVGTRDYLGLGVSASHPGGVSILAAFNPGGAHAWSWWWKLLFTAVTLASGFKGGEVTPLFFIGATLGNTLAFAASAGRWICSRAWVFVAVFAGCTNTPLACTVMGAELFGAHYLVYFAVACFVAYFFSGHSGIYMSQRVAIPKRPHGGFIPAESSLREVRELSHEIAGMELTIFQSRFSPSDDPITDTNHLNGETKDMAHQHKIVSTEMGKVRIYLKPTRKAQGQGRPGPAQRPAALPRDHQLGQGGRPDQRRRLPHALRLLQRRGHPGRGNGNPQRQPDALRGTHRPQGRAGNLLPQARRPAQGQGHRLQAHRTMVDPGEPSPAQNRGTFRHSSDRCDRW